MKSMPSDFCAQAPWQLGSRIEPAGPAEACHRAGQRPDPVGRPDDKLRDIRVTPSGMSLRSIRAPSRLHLGTATTLSLLPGGARACICALAGSTACACAHGVQKRAASCMIRVSTPSLFGGATQ